MENLLRFEDDSEEAAGDIEALARWKPREVSDREINFTPARVLLQDFTGVPAVVDLAAMREAMKRMGGDPSRINPLVPAELVIDHSVQVDEFGTQLAFRRNVEIEYERNRERYTFLRWGQTALRNFRVVPPGTGIVHQVNLEYLARVVFHDDASGAGGPARRVSRHPGRHGLAHHHDQRPGRAGLGRRWHRGGSRHARPAGGDVDPAGCRLPSAQAKCPRRVTATDLVLTVTEMLRKKGVVGKFVEFFGPGLSSLRLADRATIGNMAPEYGATCGIFPVDQKTLDYLTFTGRSKEQVHAGRSVHEGTGPLPHQRDARSGVQRHARAGPVHRRAEPGRTAPAAGSHRALASVKSTFLDAMNLMLQTTAPRRPQVRT